MSLICKNVDVVDDDDNDDGDLHVLDTLQKEKNKEEQQKKTNVKQTVTVDAAVDCGGCEKEETS